MNLAVLFSLSRFSMNKSQWSFCYFFFFWGVFILSSEYSFNIFFLSIIAISFTHFFFWELICEIRFYYCINGCINIRLFMNIGSLVGVAGGAFQMIFFCSLMFLCRTDIKLWVNWSAGNIDSIDAIERNGRTDIFFAWNREKQ